MHVSAIAEDDLVVSCRHVILQLELKAPLGIIKAQVKIFWPFALPICHFCEKDICLVEVEHRTQRIGMQSKKRNHFKSPASQDCLFVLDDVDELPC